MVMGSLSVSDIGPTAAILLIAYCFARSLLTPSSDSPPPNKVIKEEDGLRYGSDSEFDEDNSEEARAYNRALEETDGFDVPFFTFGDITPCYPGDCKLRFFAEGAIKVYNDQRKTKYKVVNVIKAMEFLAAGYVYLITFVAKSEDGDEDGDGDGDAQHTLKTFEAKVYEGLKPVPQYMFCRLQGNKQDACYGPYNRDGP